MIARGVGAMSARPVVVDLWFDPVCPYSWTASRWLEEVRARLPLEVRHHVMSLYLLNERRTDVAPEYRRNVEDSRGPSRVATALVERCGEEALGAFYTAFGTLVFDVWRRPTVRSTTSRCGRRSSRSVSPPTSRTPWRPTSTTRPCAAATTRDRPGRWRGRHSDDPPRRHGLLRARAQRDPARRRRAACLRGCSAARRLPRVLRAEADPVAAARLHLIQTAARAAAPR